MRHAGIQKAKDKPVIKVAGTPATCIYQFQSIADRDALLAVLNKVKDEAARASGAAPAPAAAAAAGTGGVIPSAEVQAQVFKMRPDLKDLHERCALSDAAPT